MYEGARRPNDQVAFLGTSGISVDKLDGEDSSDGSRFSVLPGVHSLVVSLDDRYSAPTRFREHRLSGRPLALCFAASAGHSYVAKPTYEGKQWQPVLFDEVLGAPIQVRAAETAGVDCSAPAELRDPTTMADESASVAASPPASRSAYYKTDKSYVDPRRAGTGITTELGMLFGGDNLATATFTNGEKSSLPAGSGMSISLGAQWTPLWIGNAIGIGFGGSLGYKENSIEASNGSLTLSRYPLVAALHAIVPVTDAWLLLFRGGIQSDSEVSASGSGVANMATVQLNSGLGFLGEGGFYWPFTQHLAGSLTFRYTNMHYSFEGTSFSANSLGLVWTLDLVL
jgi:hypothetical protein